MSMAIRILVCLLLPICIVSCNTKHDNGSASFEPDAEYIQIVLFHLEKRCATCNAVENETLNVLEKHFQEEVKEGEIRMVAMNFQDSEGKKAAELLRASGQTLFVVKGDSITDLTSEAFMFAQTHPERYHAALMDALEKRLN